MPNQSDVCSEVGCPGPSSGRRHLPDTRRSITHRAVIHDHEFKRVKLFVIVGLYDDGTPGELFLSADQSGTLLDGFCDAWAISVSLSLQAGIPLSAIVKKFAFTEFAPNGMTENEDIPFAKSIPDYVVQWLALQFKINL